MELSLCQRYCQVFSFVNGGIIGFVDSTTTSLHYWMFQVPLRSTAISCSSSGSFEIRRGGVASSVVTAFTFETSNNFTTRFLVTSSSLTIGQAVALASASAAVVSLTASSEL
jgi:hypothetical protein